MDSVRSPETPVLVITYDASGAGYGARFQTNPGEKGTEHVGALPAGLEQVHREGEAGVRSLTAALAWAAKQGIDLRQKPILIRGDCAPALIALQKGSYQSQVLQAQSRRFNTLCRSAEITPDTLHIPGTTMVDIGIDDLSRSQAAEVTGPTLDCEMRQHILSMLSEAGWSLTVDLFAANNNAACGRYFSRFFDEGCELVDAFTAPSWGYRKCTHCSSAGPSVWHSEVGLAFLPLGLPLALFVQKARADGFKGVVVTPAFSVSEAWKSLWSARVVSVKKHSIRFAHCKARLGPQCTTDNLVAVLVDFARVFPCLRPVLTPECFQAATQGVLYQRLQGLGPESVGIASYVGDGVPEVAEISGLTGSCQQNSVELRESSTAGKRKVPEEFLRANGAGKNFRRT